MKVVVNKCYGGFGVSHEGMMRYFEIKGVQVWTETDKFSFDTYWLVPPDQRPDEVHWQSMTMDERIAYNEAYSKATVYARDIPRDDPVLVQVVEEMGSRASGGYADLQVVEVPDDVNWCIEEYDGNEWVAEVHRTW